MADTHVESIGDGVKVANIPVLRQHEFDVSTLVHCEFATEFAHLVGECGFGALQLESGCSYAVVDSYTSLDNQVRCDAQMLIVVEIFTLKS